MRDAFWIPREERLPMERERPYLEAPSPFAMPWEPPPPRREDDDPEAPRVIVIDI